jgi:hypothetical protein
MNSPERVSTRWFPVVLFLGFLLIGIGGYLPAIRSFFHSDDFVLLTAVKNHGPFGIWSDAGSAFLRPVISLSLYIDWRFWGLQALGYHLANITVHILNSVLIAALFPLLIKEIGGDTKLPSQRSGGMLCGLLFLLQPTHPEAVTWISGRTDVYAAFFCLSSHLCYLRSGSGRNSFWKSASLLLYGLSLLSKEAAILFPLIIVALEFFRVRSGGAGGPQPKVVGTLWHRSWPFFAVVAVYLLLRVIVLGKLIGGYGAVHTSFSLMGILQSVLWFFCSAFLPLLPRWSYCFAALAVVGIAAFVRLRQKASPHPVLGFLFAAFFLAAAPVLNLGGGPAPDGMSGRLVYLASAFATLALVPLADFLLGTKSRFPALVVLAGIFGAQLFSLNLRWREAGEIAQKCIADIGSTPASGKTVVLTAPDTLYPAFILRNGLPEALTLSYPDTAFQTDVISLLNLYNAGDRISFHVRDTAGSENKMTFRLLAEKAPSRFPPARFSPYSTQGKGYETQICRITSFRYLSQRPSVGTLDSLCMIKEVSPRSPSMPIIRQP